MNYDLFLRAFNDMTEEVHNNAIAKGFYKNTNQDLIDYLLECVDPSEKRQYLIDQLYKRGQRNDAEMIALEHSELSEALESLRKNPDAPDKHCPEFTNVVIEKADAVIRIMDSCAKLGLPLAEAIVAKHKFNTTRPYKHGKKF